MCLGTWLAHARACEHMPGIVLEHVPKHMPQIRLCETYFYYSVGHLTVKQEVKEFRLQ